MEKLHSGRTRRILALAVVGGILAGGLFAASAPIVAADDDHGKGHHKIRIVDPDKKVEGLTYGEWAAEWWTWMVGEGFYPLLDTTGDLCASGQSGEVFFLAGSWAGDVTRSCTVSEEVKLFFPVQNNVWLGFPDDPYMGYPDYASPGGEAVVRAGLAASLDATSGRSVTIDGESIDDLDDYRVQSPLFDAFVPGGNAFGLPEMLLGPNVDDGWYIMLKSLHEGEHTINFVGGWPGPDVTYNLTVVDDDDDGPDDD